jgi:hypothetical protein
MYSVNCIVKFVFIATHPISLPVEERSRLFEHLCVNLLLGHAFLKV